MWQAEQGKPYLRPKAGMAWLGLLVERTKDDRKNTNAKNERTTEDPRAAFLLLTARASQSCILAPVWTHSEVCLTSTVIALIGNAEVFEKLHSNVFIVRVESNCGQENSTPEQTKETLTPQMAGILHRLTINCKLFVKINGHCKFFVKFSSIRFLT